MDGHTDHFAPPAREAARHPARGMLGGAYEVLRRLDRPVVAVLAVAAISGAIRFIALDDPAELYFDENYYARAGCIQVTGWSDRACMLVEDAQRYWREHEWDVGSWVHPHLGKLTIGLGIRLFGMEAFGWRVTSALAGVGVAVASALIAQILFERPSWTFATGLLVAVDGLNVTLSRSALLDIHVTFWVTLGFLFLVLDRRWIDRATSARSPDERVPSPLWRPWRFAAGATFGLAAGAKWSGAMAIPAAVLLTYIWETTRRHRGGVSRTRALIRTLGLETFGVVIAFVLLPLLAYAITWIPWFVHYEPSLSLWLQQHADMWGYHAELRGTALDTASDTLTPTHPFYSRPWTWIPMLRPVSFFLEELGADVRAILGVGNPVLFWGTLWTIPYCAWSWWRKRDWRPGFVVVAFAGLYLPWFLVDRPQFFFYALPLTPFMALAAVYTMRDLAAARLVVRDESGAVAVVPGTGEPAISRRKPYLPFVWGYFAAAVGLFLWMWPILTAGRISDLAWRARVWFPGWT